MNPCIPHLKWCHSPQQYHLKSHTPTISSEKESIHYASLSAMLNPLHSSTNQELFEKNLCNPRILKERVSTMCLSYINYCLKSEVSITLRYWLCSTHYTAVRIKNCLKNTSAIKVANMKNTDDFHYKEKPSRATTKLTVSKDE